MVVMGQSEPKWNLTTACNLNPLSSLCVEIFGQTDRQTDALKLRNKGGSAIILAPVLTLLTHSQLFT